MGRLVAIDYGLARIGVALSDERKIISSMHWVIQADRSAKATTDKLLLSLLPYTPLDTIVVGFPLLLSGKQGFLADEVQFFISLLKERTSCPIVLLDERLSTAQATRFLKEEALLSRKKRSKVVDSITASLLLQNYIDSLLMVKERLS